MTLRVKKLDRNINWTWVKQKLQIMWKVKMTFKIIGGGIRLIYTSTNIELGKQLGKYTYMILSRLN